MSKDGIGRREAMERLLAFVAVAAGFGAADGKLFAQTLRKVQKTDPTRLKFLKLRLSGFNSRIFTNQFGRATPLVSASKVKITTSASLPTTQAKPLTQVRPIQTTRPDITAGAMGCQVQFAGAAGAMGGADCPTFSACGLFSDSGGSACSELNTCGDNICNGQDFGGGSGGGGGCMGVNDCNGQDCGQLDVCGDNECTEQSCPSLSGCGRNKRDIAGLINIYRNDPFIRDLMQQLKMTNVNELAVQVETMIRDRRTINVRSLRSE